jgi:cell division protein FtsW
MMLARANFKPGDRQLILYITILILFGLIVLTSASSPWGYAKFQDNYFFVKRQLLYGLVPGVILFFIGSNLNYQWWKKLSWVVYGATLILLGLVFINGVGVVLNGSRSWLNIGGISFQPGELAKLAVVIVLAALLTKERFDWSNWQTSLLPVLAIIAPIPLLVVLQPDVGTVSIIAFIIFFMLYIARVPGIYMTILGFVGILSFVI